MMQKRLLGLFAGASSALALGFAAVPASAQELTIFWAEWDPANYLQELVNDYTAETGVTVTVQTTPWSDFQTKTFAELNAHGDAYDMVVGDSQWLGAGSTGGHYVDLTDVLRGAQPRRGLRAGDGQVLFASTTARTGRSRSRATPTAGPTARTGSRIRPRWPPSRRSTATTSACRRTTSSCATSPSSSTGPTRTATASRSTPRPPMTRWRWGSSRRSSPTAAISATTRPARPTASSTRRRTSRRWSSTASSTSSRRRTGARRSSWRTTRRSPRAWWR